MKKYIVIFVIGAFVSCGDLNKDMIDVVEKEIRYEISNQISSGKSLADSPFLTKNHQNDPVLSWVEGEGDSTFLYLSVLKVNEKAFSTPIQVSTTRGLIAHKETMPKLAFKADGTMIVVYQKRIYSPTNRFSGAIYYTQSFDNGKTWSSPNYIHTDTSQGVGRSFFDISVLPDGEIGAVWLDGRKRQSNGSTLCFAKTKGKNGFGKDIEIGQKTCQCCRTDIFVDNLNEIHVAYRDIINDTIRDIVHLSSVNNGLSFTESTRISKDNWVFNGCPHTGPSITNSKKGISFYWFTSGGTDGVYTTTLTKNTNHFSERELINPHARHPQAVTLKNGTSVLVWDETFKTKEGFINRIGIKFKTVNGLEKIDYITKNDVDCDHPVLIEFENNKVLVAWNQRTPKNETSQVYHTVIYPNEYF